MPLCDARTTHDRARERGCERAAFGEREGDRVCAAHLALHVDIGVRVDEGLKRRNAILGGLVHVVNVGHVERQGVDV